MNKKNCKHCGDEDEVCEQCKQVIICQDCYHIIQPYDDDDSYKIFTCSECAKQYPNQQTLRL